MNRQHHALPSDRHLRAIGLVNVLWGAIEAAMELAICHLYDVSMNVGLVFTANISFQSRLAMLRIAAMDAETKAPDAIALAGSLLARIERGAALRNNAAHGLWSATDDPDIARRMAVKAKGNRLRTTRDDVTAEGLEADAEALTTLLEDCKAWMEGLGVFPDLPDRHD